MKGEGFSLLPALVRVYLGVSFVMLFCKLGNKNFDTGHIECCQELHLACRPQVSHPCFTIKIELKTIKAFTFLRTALTM